MSRTRTPKTQEQKKKIKADGDRAYMPPEVFRTPLWSLTASNAKKLEEGQVYFRKLTNSHGDYISVRANDILRPSPDMGVLLTLIATFQKTIFGNPAYDLDAYGNEERGYFDFSCTIVELMRLTGIRHEKRLLESLERLGSVQIQFKRANPQHGEAWFGLIGMFTFNIKRVNPTGSKRTHKNDKIRIHMHRAFIPQKEYLYKSAQQCLALTKDTSRLIFWALCSRKHLKGTAEEWYAALCPEDTKTNNGEMSEQARQKLLWKWINLSFLPALEELKAVGFAIKINQNARNGTTYCIEVQKRQARAGANSDRVGEISDRVGENSDRAGENSDRAWD